MPDQMTTTSSLGGGAPEEEPMSAVADALEALRQAMLDEGQDPTTVDAKLKMAQPRQENLVGNIADMMRAGESTTEASEAAESGEGEVDFESMTKAELQAELDSRGVEYNASDTKSDLLDRLAE